ncbi:MAG TPA: hypothetical protein VKG44_09465 [Candidatus Baltobacteraceae bacterium]|nr:hypothetical protein [Candidatus Baltobacteraceae bacterium]
MTDLYKPIADDRNNNAKDSHSDPPPANDAGRTLLVGVLGGLASAAGYLIYTRLPEEHKEKLNQQVRTVVEARINEVRSRLNF